MSVQNLISVLERRDAAALQSLRSEFPDEQRLFAASRQMGETPRGARANRSARVALINRALPALRIECDAILETLVKRLHQAGRWKTVGSAISAVSNAGLVPAVITQKGTIAIALAVVAFAAALVTILIDRAEGHKGGVRKLFDEVASASGSIASYEREAVRIREASVDVESLDDLLGRIDEIAAQVHRSALVARVI